MRISVIVPTHRRPNSLRHALASLRAQTHADWEALVVDDGDGEGAKAALSLADPRVSAWRNPGRGQVDARNAALSAASGAVAMWLDDDDWLEDPEHMARVAAVLGAGPALVTRGGWLVAVDPGDPVTPVERGRAPFDLPADAESLRRDNTVLTAGLAYPLELHRALGPLDRELDGYFDWDWHLRVVTAGFPVVRLPGLGVAYRQHPGNRSRHLTDDRRRRFAALVRKHTLDVVIKDHAGVLAEQAAASPDAAAPTAASADAGALK
jgi:glycosyltransferase involved in cell wall biosynthesis